MEILRKFVRLADQIPLTEEQTKYCDSVSAWYSLLLQQRFTRSAPVDQPAGNWVESQPFYDRPRAVSQKANALYNRLRLYSQQFTGWSLGAFARGEEPSSVNYLSSAEAIDENLCSSPQAESLITKLEQILDCLPPYLHISAPPIFGEIGIAHRGLIVNGDTLAYYERILLLYLSGLLDRNCSTSLFYRPGPVTIVEIGGGYGGLAFYLCRALSNCRYVIIDLPESLFYSAMYLPIALPCPLDITDGEKLIRHVGNLRFVPNFLATEFFNGCSSVDLAINTLSMAEMSEEQVRHYACLIRDHLNRNGVFFEQNQDNRHLGFLYVQDILSNYFTDLKTITSERVPIVRIPTKSPGYNGIKPPGIPE